MTRAAHDTQCGVVSTTLRGTTVDTHLDMRSLRTPAVPAHNPTRSRTVYKYAHATHVSVRARTSSRDGHAQRRTDTHRPLQQLRDCAMASTREHCQHASIAHPRHVASPSRSDHRAAPRGPCRRGVLSRATPTPACGRTRDTPLAAGGSPCSRCRRTSHTRRHPPPSGRRTPCTTARPHRRDSSPHDGSSSEDRSEGRSER
jgi:hypothetical protein